MATDQTAVNDWQNEWFEIEGGAYVNTAAPAVMPAFHCARCKVRSKPGPRFRSECVGSDLPYDTSSVKQAFTISCCRRSHVSRPVRMCVFVRSAIVRSATGSTRI